MVGAKGSVPLLCEHAWHCRSQKYTVETLTVSSIYVFWKCCVTVAPLSRQQQHSFKLSLPENKWQTSKLFLSTFKQTPPWMLVSDSITTLPLVLSSQTLKQLLESHWWKSLSYSVPYQVCQLAQRKYHKSSPEHKNALEMHRSLRT